MPLHHAVPTPLSAARHPGRRQRERRGAQGSPGNGATGPEVCKARGDPILSRETGETDRRRDQAPSVNSGASTARASSAAETSRMTSSASENAGWKLLPHSMVKPRTLPAPGVAKWRL